MVFVLANGYAKYYPTLRLLVPLHLLRLLPFAPSRLVWL